MPQSFPLFSTTPLDIANSNTLIAAPNVVVPAASSVSVLASNNNRMSVIVTNLDANITIIIGGPTVALGEGTPLDPSQSYSINTRAEIFVFNPDAVSAINVAITFTELVEL